MDAPSNTTHEPVLHQESLTLTGQPESDGGKMVSVVDASRTRYHKHRKHCFTKASKPKKANIALNTPSAPIVNDESISQGRDIFFQEENSDSPVQESSQVLNAGTWRSPTQVERNSGAAILGRPIRVWWDGDQQWFVGVVIDHNPDPNAVDGHGDVGPTFTVRYDDGIFDENLEVVFSLITDHLYN